MSKTILITGAAGFLGSNLCEFLLGKGETVIGVDNLYTGSKKTIEHLLENPNFKFIQHDICLPLAVTQKIDQIYNLACAASPVHYQADPIGTVKVNTIGVMNVLNIARFNQARVLQASTSEVYGDPLVHPQTEDYRGNVSTTGIRACYDEGKRVAETLFFDYKRKHNVDIRVARIFNTYGPKMNADDGRVVSNFIVQALKGEDISIYGKGEQTRSFCYVSDMIEGLYALMNSDTVGPVNLGNEKELTILEIAQILKNLTNSNSKIVFKDLPEDDPTRRNPDITLAKTKLNWQPKVTLEDGLKKTVEYFRT